MTQLQASLTMQRSAVTVMRRALIVEDERDIANLIALHLRDLNLQVVISADGAQGLRRALEESWSLIVLDLTLPSLDGLRVCEELRAAGITTPILVLSARNAEHERILGLDAGADDYLGKPFSIHELIARVRAILRRMQREASPAVSIIDVAGLRIVLARREVLLAGVAVELTAREFDLLAHLASHPGRVFSRAQLLDQVWGSQRDSYEHTVSSHINRLRAKLERDPAHPLYVQTVWGVGYRFGGAHA